jgi:hypothetical protein
MHPGAVGVRESTLSSIKSRRQSTTPHQPEAVAGWSGSEGTRIARCGPKRARTARAARLRGFRVSGPRRIRGSCSRHREEIWYLTLVLGLVSFLNQVTTLPANLVTIFGGPPARDPFVVVSSPTGLHLGAAAGDSQANGALPY